MLKTIKNWFRRNCTKCGCRKPMFTAFCDSCWEAKRRLEGGWGY